GAARRYFHLFSLYCDGGLGLELFAAALLAFFPFQFYLVSLAGDLLRFNAGNTSLSAWLHALADLLGNLIYFLPFAFLPLAILTKHNAAPSARFMASLAIGAILFPVFSFSRSGGWYMGR
ncbi:MAG: hypothetical protein ACXWQO_11905, partial [Bdellovibrionota bacterium]